MKLSLPQIRHDQAGFEALVHFAKLTEECFFDVVEVDLSTTTWLDADMCAALGAILYRLNSHMNTVDLSNAGEKLEQILSKNGFLSHYGRQPVSDRWGTTIAYQRFEVRDDRYFAGYIENELIQRSEMPAMTDALKKKFRESIFEIFSNAVLHSRTQLGIFSCGQYYPKRQRLDFSVADLGIGMRENIRKSLGLDLLPEKAIAWATQDRNTTKRGPVPGGLGLKLLREFIDLNGGSIQIVSDAGYWRRTNCQTSSARLSHPFPGTVVTLEINTADSNSYALVSELTPADIF